MSKINKIGKSSFVIAILSFVLVAVLAFGSTYAYFTAKTNTVAGSVTTGHLDIGVIKADGSKGVVAGDKLTFASDIVVPNETLVNSVFSADVHSNIAFYSRVKFSVKFTLSEEVDTHKHYTETDEKWDETANEGAGGYVNNTDTAVTDCQDYIADAINALIIKLNGDATAKLSAALPTDSEAQEAAEAAITGFTNSGVQWEIGTQSEATKATETTAYFYNVKRHAATAIGTDTTLYFPAFIQLEDFLGRAIAGDAQRCPYWMDAKIEISISFEVMQADCVAGANVDTNGTFVAGEGEGASAVKSAEDAWAYALAQTKNPGVESV